MRELGYTAAAAWRRIKAMRLSTQIGVAGELLRDGSLALSNAAQLQNLFERSDRNHGHPPGSHGAGGGPGGAPRNDGAPGNPASAAPMRGGERGPAPGGRPVLDAATREKLVKQAAGKSTREVQQMLAEVDPELAQPSDRVRALGNGCWELKATVGAECRHGLEKLQMLLSHKDPHLTLGALVAHLVQDGLKRYDPAHPRRLRRTGGPASSNGGQSTHTPSAGGVQRAAASAAKRPVEGVQGQMGPRRCVTAPAVTALRRRNAQSPPFAQSPRQHAANRIALSTPACPAHLTRTGGTAAVTPLRRRSAGNTPLGQRTRRHAATRIALPTRQVGAPTPSHSTHLTRTGGTAATRTATARSQRRSAMSMTAWRRGAVP